MNWYIIFENNEKIKDLLVWFNKQPDMKAFIVKSERFWKKDGKKMFIEKPMYPNYIFVETNLDSKEFAFIVPEFSGAIYSMPLSAGIGLCMFFCFLSKIFFFFTFLYLF